MSEDDTSASGSSDASENVIERLYRGLGARDGQLMTDCYTADARFYDPVFGELTDGRPQAMWRMLTAASDGVDVHLSDVSIDGNTASARWEARYVFGATGRPVVNRASARYRLVEGLIAEHVDHFSFHAWASQALGPTGKLFGWLPVFRNKVRAGALHNLERFMADHG